MPESHTWAGKAHHTVIKFNQKGNKFAKFPYTMLTINIIKYIQHKIADGLYSLQELRAKRIIMASLDNKK